MKNTDRLKNLSRTYTALLTLSMWLAPSYYLVYWIWLNDLPETFITVNVASVPLVDHPLSMALRGIGLAASILPCSALLYGLFHLRRLFVMYREGVIFSDDQVKIFKKIAWALVGWGLLSVVYESAKSILFSYGNPPGQGVVTASFDSGTVTSLIVAGTLLVIAYVMEEGRRLVEENKLTI